MWLGSSKTLFTRTGGRLDLPTLWLEGEGNWLGQHIAKSLLQWSHHLCDLEQVIYPLRALVLSSVNIYTNIYIPSVLKYLSVFVKIKWDDNGFLNFVNYKAMYTCILLRVCRNAHQRQLWLPASHRHENTHREEQNKEKTHTIIVLRHLSIS